LSLFEEERTGQISKMVDMQRKTSMSAVNDKYSMSFTTGSLFHQESVKVAALFLALQNWSAVREVVLAENLLQSRTINTLERVYREIAARLKTLCDRELELLVDGTMQEQGYILWLSVCRRYQFISDFATEILRERYINFKMMLQYEDFDAFFNEKAEWHDELDRVADATRIKCRQVIFKMLREAGLLTDSHIINPVMLSSRLLKAIPESQRQDILVFPVFLADLRRWA
jgi:hypothetical protein